ncbi:HNH endonuclease [Bacillus wiedmannii]|uniref:HNH endonuclease n=1 Tax=Bacillus wiedmannii TaxID=1890302 RepID=UPI0009C0FD7D
MGRKIFTNQQLDYISRQLNTLPVGEIANRLGLKEAQVRYIIKEKLGISLRKNGKYSRSWAKEEIDILSDPNLTDYEKVQRLPRRSDSAVRIQRKRMGFKSKPIVFHREYENNGYIHVRKNGKYERRCRVVAEQKIGRKLRSDEVVHHINGRKTDDRPENLYVCTRNEHTTIHYQTMEVIDKLMEKGIVQFDELQGRYVLCRNL